MNGNGPADGKVGEMALNRSSFWILHVGFRAGSEERRREHPSSTPVEEEVRTGDLHPNSAPQEGEA